MKWFKFVVRRSGMYRCSFGIFSKWLVQLCLAAYIRMWSWNVSRSTVCRKLTERDKVCKNLVSKTRRVNHLASLTPSPRAHWVLTTWWSRPLHLAWKNWICNKYLMFKSLWKHAQHFDLTTKHSLNQGLVCWLKWKCHHYCENSSFKKLSRT